MAGVIVVAAAVGTIIALALCHGVKDADEHMEELNGGFRR